MIVYTVRACRWNNSETHSYIVGVYTSKEKAIKAAESEEIYRGGKYGCEVLEWELNKSYDHDYSPKEILVPWEKVIHKKGKICYKI